MIAGSVITRSEWDALETSVSDIVGILSPGVSDTVYLLYGVAILALPFAILIQLIVGRRWKLLAGYAAAGLIAGVALSFTGSGLAARAGTSTSRTASTRSCRSSSTTPAGSRCSPPS